MNTLQKKLALGLTVITVGIAAGAFAQSAPSTPPAPPAPTAAGDHAGHGRAPADPAKWAEKMKERTAKHQAELHDKLKITAAQEPAWKTFTDAMNPGTLPARPDHKELAKLSTPDRMEKGLEKMKEHLAKMQTRLTALKTFYAVLTPDQQKIFDESHRRMESRMRERMSQGDRGNGGPGGPGGPGHDMHRDGGGRPPMGDKKN
ncbi:Spy/CpxP family protein refolding chaperone [Undibacterium sp. CY18W]|uniref:Spy/CpxP family protein refolding chaperone n=1 Tax=Undibacterium hunanense TaxID=2762292 RepID=A0ABR6ZZ34_9BURK|nr:Spy/CpxP family protein refolding chaperone [Undibacterium hunanense]MBC3920924.1 Spy/CpxP family protein refolding chaperone [Undibacterium hunanense]